MNRPFSRWWCDAHIHNIPFVSDHARLKVESESCCQWPPGPGANFCQCVTHHRQQIINMNYPPQPYPHIITPVLISSLNYPPSPVTLPIVSFAPADSEDVTSVDRLRDSNTLKQPLGAERSSIWDVSMIANEETSKSHTNTDSDRILSFGSSVAPLGPPAEIITMSERVFPPQNTTEDSPPSTPSSYSASPKTPVQSQHDNVCYTF